MNKFILLIGCVLILLSCTNEVEENSQIENSEIIITDSIVTVTKDSAYLKMIQKENQRIKDREEELKEKNSQF